MSFGFKYGLPVDADLVVGHALPAQPALGPGAAPLHRPRTRRCRNYVLNQPGAKEFLDRYCRAAAADRRGLPSEGKRYVTVAVGCTGGKHRSVAMSEKLAARLAAEGVETVVVHRDMDGNDRGMTGRTPRLSRLRRVVPEERGGRPADAPAARPEQARGGKPRRRGAQPKVVALGGGMGLSASLAALRRITGDLTAVVTVADDGGSSGRLRNELGVLPPGDLRRALAALCGDDDWGHTWARVIQHRFQSQGDLHEHAVGNLLIVALWEQLGDHVQALDLVGRLLGAHGRVLPMSAVPLELQALVSGPRPGAARRGGHRTRAGDRGAHARRGAVRAPGAQRPAGRPRGGRRGPGRRLGGARPRLLVLLGHPAPAGAGSGRTPWWRRRRAGCSR